MTVRPRPLSPHLQIWRWHITMTASILFRVTIGAASVGALFGLAWLAALTKGPEVVAQAQALSASPLGLLVWVGLTWVVFSFVLNGARHLINDFTIGLDLKTANLMSWIAVLGPVFLTALVWGYLFGAGSVSL
jgi:succinate dehydrogenase / fumarate reductase, cytochrome b subunit